VTDQAMYLYIAVCLHMCCLQVGVHRFHEMLSFPFSAVQFSFTPLLFWSDKTIFPCIIWPAR